MKGRVLVITPWRRRWEMGNAAGVADDHYFVAEMVKHEYEVHFLCPRGDATPGAADLPCTVHTFPDVLTATERLPSLFRRPLWLFLFNAWVLFHGGRVARRVRPSIILGQTHLGSFAVRRLARGLGVPSVMKLFGVVDLDRTEWSRLHYYRRNLEQVLAFKVPHDAWIILDDGTAGDVAARRHGVPPERVHLLPNGVNVEWSQRPASPGARGRFGIAEGASVVLFLSRLTGWKRPDLFIRMAPRIMERAHKPVHFVMAGDGPMRGRCEALIRDLELQSNISLLGPVPHDRVPDLLHITDVLAGTNERSNRGIPTSEAMVCAVPVVAFAVGDTASVVKDGRTGRLIPEGHANEFADAIADLLNHPPLREQMGREAQAFATRHFTGWPQRIALERRLFDELIARADG